MNTKNKLRALDKGLQKYYDLIGKCEQDAKTILEKGAVNLREHAFGENAYLFISLDMKLYCKKAELDHKGIILVKAGEFQYDDDAPYSLEWCDMSQDAIVFADFMTALYESVQR